MEISFTFSVFVKLLSVILGMLTGIILWLYPRKIRSPNKILGTSLIIISLGLCVSFLIETGLILKVPHVYRSGNLFALLFMPLSYLYMRLIIRQDKLHRWDIIHTLPPLLFIIDFFPFYLLSADEKRLILQQDLMDLNQLLSYEQGGFTPQGFHLIFRQLTWVVYWLLQVRLLMQVKTYWSAEIKQENRSWLHWAQMIAGFQIFFFLPYSTSLLLDTYRYNWVTTTTVIAIFFVFISTYMFFRPDILYGIKGVILPTNKKISKKNSLQEGAQYLNEEKVKAMKEQIQTLMESNALFLQHGFTLQDLAEKIHIPYHQISAIINRETQMNFKDYLNQYRIQYCIERMKEGEWKKITLEALAYECGFNNRNSFTLSFKKFTGLTPSEYIKQLK